MAKEPADIGTIRQAREILGAPATHLSDDDIRHILQNLNLLAQELLDMQERGEL